MQDIAVPLTTVACSMLAPGTAAAGAMMTSVDAAVGGSRSCGVSGGGGDGGGGSDAAGQDQLRDELARLSSRIAQLQQSEDERLARELQAIELGIRQARKHVVS